MSNVIPNRTSRDRTSSSVKKASRLPYLHAVDYTQEDFDTATRNDHFLELRMPIVFKCNLRCVYCNQDAPFDDEELNVKLKSANSKYPVLTTQERVALIEQAAELGARTVVFSGAGETALCKDLMDLVSSVCSNGMNCLVVSNLIPIDEELGTRLNDLGVDIMGKLNTFRPTRQAELVGLEKAYDVFYERIMLMVDLGFTRGHRFSVNSVICKENYCEMLPLFVFCREHDIIPWIEKVTIEGRADEEIDVTLEQTQDLFQKAAQLDESVYGHSWTPCPPVIASPTYERYKYMFTIDMFGNAFPSNASMSMQAGNVREKSLLELYRSPRFREAWKIDKHLRDKLGENQVPMWLDHNRFDD